MEDTNEEVEVDIGLESVKEGIVFSLSVTVVVKVDVGLELIKVGECRLLDWRQKDVSANQITENAAFAQSEKNVLFSILFYQNFLFNMLQKIILSSISAFCTHEYHFAASIGP